MSSPSDTIHKHRPSSPIGPRPFRAPLSTSTHFPDEKHSDHITIDVHENPSDANPSEGSNPSDPLHIFHVALGIPPPKPKKAPKPSKKDPNPDKPAPRKLADANRGVYAQVMINERWARWKYFSCDAIITLAMFLQIIVGASVTAFGAGSASHVLITCFGAANTALASLLAVLKSQGLPNRIRQDWNGWRELREFIEEKEREIEMIVSGRVETGKCPVELDVWGLVRDVEDRYKAVRLTLEANRPDTYIPVPPMIKK